MQYSVHLYDTNAFGSNGVDVLMQKVWEAEKLKDWATVECYLEYQPIVVWNLI